MTVFVDDMYRVPMGNYGRMRMSHMIADTEDELHAMADKLGLRRSWYQGDHYDVSMSKRAEAIALGAVPVEMRILSVMVKNQRAGYPLGTPDTCHKIFLQRCKDKIKL